MARIEALARRSGGFTETAASPEVLTSGAFSFDTGSLEVRCGDTPINLTPKERDLVKLYLSSPRKIFSRERILSSLWGMNQDPRTNVVDVYIDRLRKTRPLRRVDRDRARGRLPLCGGWSRLISGALPITRAPGRCASDRSSSQIDATGVPVFGLLPIVTPAPRHACTHRRTASTPGSSTCSRHLPQP